MDPLAGMPVLIEARGLCKRYGGHVVLDGVDLELRRGEVVLLRGDNGTGKTTLLDILTGNLEPDEGTLRFCADDTPREYRFPRRWWQELNPWDHFTPEYVAREGVTRTWQEVRLFESQTVASNISVAEMEHPGESPVSVLFTPGRSARGEARVAAKVDRLLGSTGLAGLGRRVASQTSLGQSKRVAIARAIATGTRVLFLDEPLAGLDGRGVADIRRFLAELVAEGLTLVIVEHVSNQPLLEGLVTTDWLLSDGGLSRAYVDAGFRERTYGGMSTFDAVSRGRAWLAIFERSRPQVSVDALPRGATITRLKAGLPEEASAAPLLQVSDLVVRRGNRPVIGLDEDGREVGLTLALHEGEIGVLEAPNGWGKTTLFAAIAGLIPVERGSIVLAGLRIESIPPWERHALGLRMMISESGLFPTLTTGEVLDLAGRSEYPPWFDKLAGRVCGTLSGGEQRRLALASFHGGRVGLCDEPFHALDQRGSQAAAEYLSGLGGALLVGEPRRTAA